MLRCDDARMDACREWQRAAKPLQQHPALSVPRCGHTVPQGCTVASRVSRLTTAGLCSTLVRSFVLMQLQKLLSCAPTMLLAAHDDYHAWLAVLSDAPISANWKAHAAVSAHSSPTALSPAGQPHQGAAVDTGRTSAHPPAQTVFVSGWVGSEDMLEPSASGGGGDEGGGGGGGGVEGAGDAEGNGGDSFEGAEGGSPPGSSENEGERPGWTSASLNSPPPLIPFPAAYVGQSALDRERPKSTGDVPYGRRCLLPLPVAAACCRRRRRCLLPHQ